jgi:NADH-quinone oxidoreductase subunit N
MDTFSKPTIEYAELWPLLVVFGVAVLGVLVEAFLPRERRHNVQVGLTGLGLVVALAGSIYVGTGLDKLRGAGDAVLARGQLAAQGTLVVDGPTVFLWGLVLVFSIAGVALFAERRLEGGVSAFAGQAAALPGTEAEREASTRGLDHTEVYPLMMFAVAGMMLFPTANDLLTLFVALEVLSLPLYLLCGLARRRRLLSQEAALKYFLLGAFSSGFFLYGVALIYGFAGSMQFADISEAVRNDTGNSTLLLIGMGMLAVGLLFKVGAVPFHSWTPDVYQGAPTAVTAFMAACTKIAAFGALLRLFYVAFGAQRWDWQPMLWIVAIATMLVGAILAAVQTDIKRMLAYSAVAHTGFLLTGVLGLQATSALGDGEITSLQAVLFYLAAYAPATVGTFAIVTLVRDAGGEATSYAAWAGLGRRSPLVGGAFAFMLLSMAGIPLTGGFIGKWAVFEAAFAAGAWPVVLVAIAASIISVFFYVRVILLMFFTDPVPGETAAVTRPSVLTSAVIAVCTLLVLFLGVVPGPVLDLAGHAGQFVR